MPDADAGLRQRLSAGARRWQAYEKRARQRDGFYAAGSFSQRLRRLWQLAVVARAYRSREAGGLGGLALVRDLRELAVPKSAAEPLLGRRNPSARSQPPNKVDRPTSSQNSPRCGRV